MKTFTTVLICIAALALIAPTASANNDCCWDWNPAPGAFDKPGQPGPLPGGPPRVGAPFGWAHCTANGPGIIACFSRQGRQAFLPNWTCIIGSNDPNGNPPVAGAGFLCTKKPDPIQTCFLTVIDQVTDPPGMEAIIDFEGVSIPTMSEWGLIALSIMMIGGGMWIMRRRSVAAAA